MLLSRTHPRPLFVNLGRQSNFRTYAPFSVSPGPDRVGNMRVSRPREHYFGGPPGIKGPQSTIEYPHLHIPTQTSSSGLQTPKSPLPVALYSTLIFPLPTSMSSPCWEVVLPRFDFIDWLVSFKSASPILCWEKLKPTGR